MMVKDYFPNRIVCLTEETTETLYLLGQSHRIVGISQFTKRPALAVKEKPKVSAFLNANIQKILALKPDLVIGFSDIQANIARELISLGVDVWVTNHRSVQGILNMIVQLGSIVGQGERAVELAGQFEKELDQIRKSSLSLPLKPRVYFEEWYDPYISAIGWVGEIIEIAGGENIFASKSQSSLAKDRIIEDPAEIIEKNPDIILASWCGKKFKKSQLVNRPNWQQIKAVKNNQVFEIDSTIILQPGPAALTDGIRTIEQIIRQWQMKN